MSPVRPTTPTGLNGDPMESGGNEEEANDDGAEQHNQVRTVRYCNSTMMLHLTVVPCLITNSIIDFSALYSFTRGNRLVQYIDCFGSF